MCPNVQPCPVHTREAWGRKGNVPRVPGDRDYQRLREWVLWTRDEGMCQPCRKAGKHTLATEVDHIVPRSRGGDVRDPANMQAICVPCHDAKGQRDRGAE